MKKKILAAVVCVAAVLSLAGCGSENPTSNMLNPQTSKNDGVSNTNIFTEKKPGIWTVMPEIPVTDESAFEYRYDREMGGMVITNYLNESPKVRIPDTFAGEPVKAVDLSDCEKEITQLVMPDSVIELGLSYKTGESLQYINLPNDMIDYNIWFQYYKQHTSSDNDGFRTESEFYEQIIDSIYYLFGSCENLISIGVSEKNPRFCSVDGMLCYNYQDRFVLLVCPLGKSGSVTIPDNITEINASAFGENGNGTYATTSGGEGEGALNIIYKNKTYNSIYEMDNIIKIHEDDIALHAKVTSADVEARSLCDEVQCWILDDITAGGMLQATTQISISCNNGIVTIAETLTKAAKHDETLKELLESDYQARTFAAKVFLNDGKAVSCVLQDGVTALASNIPDASAWQNGGLFTWKSAKEAGVLPTGEIVGTYPKLSHRD